MKRRDGWQDKERTEEGRGLSRGPPGPARRGACVTGRAERSAGVRTVDQRGMEQGQADACDR